MVELGKLMVYIEKQNQSFSLFKGDILKWTTSWKNTFIFLLRCSKFIINLIPPLKKKEIFFFFLQFASSAQLFKTEWCAQTSHSTPAFYKSDKLSFKCLSPICWKNKEIRLT